MSGFIVEGKTPLKGSIKVAGNKNEALPLIAASLLCPSPVKLTNVPDIGDVRTMLEICSSLGAVTSAVIDGVASIDPSTLNTSILPLELSNRIRASVLFASALLVKTGKAVISQPGGDMIGRRRMDTHFLVFTALGAKLNVEKKMTSDITQQTNYVFEVPGGGLRGADIYLDEASVTATENALIAASGASGVTVIANAASEPHVQGLCRFLTKIGVTIDGIGSNVLTVHGTNEFKTSNHEIGSDFIEAGSFIGLAAATKSELTITDIDPIQMRMILFQFERIGIAVEMDKKGRSMLVSGHQSRRIRRDLGGAIPRIEDSPWPGFPTDLMSILLVAATQSEGICLIHEKMFESRLFFVDKLIVMGGQVVLCDPHRVVISGPAPLYGSKIISPDIRAGMALLIAACAAEGRSIIQNIEQIDRGYQQVDQRLNALGASIERITEC